MPRLPGPGPSLRVHGPLALAVVWLLATVTSASLALREYRADALQHAELEARAHGARLLRLLERYGPEGKQLVGDELAFISANPSLVEALVIGADGVVQQAADRHLVGKPANELVSDADLALLAQATDSRLAQISLDTGEGRMAYATGFQPPDDAHLVRSTRRGTVYLRYDLRPVLHDVVRHALSERLPDFAMMILLTGIAFLWSRRHVVKPLEALRAMAAAASRGTFQRADEHQGAMEIRSLAEAFNRMTAQIERQLRALEDEAERTRAVLDNMHDGVVVTDALGRVTLMNKSAEAMFEVDAQTIKGRHFRHMLEHGAENFRRLMLAAESRGTATREGQVVELQGRRPSGQEF